MSRPTLYLVDGPNMAFRAHYAIRGLTNSKGEATGALFGYCSMLFQLLKDRKPDYLCLVWDPPGDVFRNAIYPEYKGTRSETPDELKKQFPIFPELAEALGIRHVVVPGYEADDVIGTLAVACKERCDVRIVTGDKDMMQLVDGDRVQLVDTMKNLVVGPDEVKERWGVGPDRIIDILSLMGDSSDNIPGVRGIGEKGAAELIQQFGSMKEVFEHLAEVKGRNKRPLEAEGARASAELSYRLATIQTGVPLDFGLDDLRYSFPPADPDAIAALFQRLEFHRFLTEIGGAMKSVKQEKYRCVTTEVEFRELVAALRASQTVSIDTETTSKDPHRASLVGLSLCADDAVAWYLPLGHVGEGSEKQLPKARALLYLRSILENPKKRFIGQNLKYDAIVLLREGIRLPAVSGDTMLASFLLNPARQSHGLDGLALTWLRHKMIAYDEVTAGTDGHFEKVPLDKATAYSAEDSHVVWLLHPKMQEQMQEQGVAPLYRDVELPLVSVLARMERRGIRVDVDMLRAYGEELAVAIQAAEEETWKHAGQEFNSASPKQLAEILFEKLGLPVIKKTKTGPSTDASVLEELADQHPLPEAILRFRSLSKLKSTYVDALPPLVNPETGRIHTDYSQVAAATGRLSSQDPNLQNIPIRTPEGRRIRQAFVPEPGFVFLSADYSQVELRVLAHLCGGEGGFARAFAEGKDVHKVTAAEVFSVHEAFVTSEMRRTAKAINFGLVYGQTDFGLGRALHISRKEAAAYIERYKKKYPEIDAYMERTVEGAQENGYVTTILGRRRPITDLTSSNWNQRQQARRIAINTPVQGSAADIIKLAMLRIDKALQDEFPQARMLLQVHDELVFELPESLLERVRERVVQEMESAMPLLVPLQVDSGAGRNWDEAH